MNNHAFQKHTSKALINFYQLKNFQGVNPSDAKFIFVGKDPNWASNIEDLYIFKMVEEYLADGVNFWKKYNIHHPFLSPEYKGDGKKYHQAFSRLNLSNKNANEISFVEIIGFPTTGMSSRNNKKFNEYVLSVENKKQLVELDQLLKDSEKIFFLFWGMIDYFKFLNKKTGLFTEFINFDKEKMVRTDLNKVGNVYFHKHFSMGISQSTLNKISDLIVQI